MATKPPTSKLSAPATAVAHYAEVALKGGYRPFFEKKLAENVQVACEREGVRLGAVRRERGRILVTFEAEDTEKAQRALRDIFGIQYFALVEETASTPEAILAKARELLAQAKQAGAATVGLVTKRADKRFPLSSLELNKEIGAEANRLGLKIRFEGPEATLHTEIATERAFLYRRKIPGPGGLPVGASGKVLCLLSGGIDSPVASWLLLKRGCRVDFLHFHSFRTNREALESKLRATVEALNRFQFHARLFLVPYHSYQIAAAGRVPEGLDLMAFKNFMLRAAQAVAWRKGYRALVTGDSLGQVASQTLPNLAAGDEGIAATVLRPLVGFDKVEIVALARRIGTYEESIKPYKDCCSIISRKPATAITAAELRGVFGEEAMKELLAKSLAEMEVFKVGQATEAEPAPAGDLSAT
ncbi:MAG: tRNA uracil 4-sulfurtransferase ThiI [Candidatus Acidiferrales bacterium]